MANDDMIKCKYCEADIPKTAIKCMHCGEWQDPEHLVSIIASSPSYNTIQNSVLSHVKDEVGSRLKTVITIVTPIVLFLLGGAGVFLVKGAISDSLLTMKQAEYVVNSARSSIDEIEKAEALLNSLKKSKEMLEKDIKSTIANIESLRNQSSNIAKESLKKVKEANGQILNITNAIRDIDDRLSKVEKNGHKSKAVSVAVNEQKKIESETDESLLDRIELVKYTIRVGSHPGIGLPTEKIVSTLLKDNFTAIIHEFRDEPKENQSFNTIVIGREIPNAIIASFIRSIKAFKSSFSYIRLNYADNQNRNVFIGSNSDISKSKNIRKLTDEDWNKLSDKNTDIVKYIDDLVVKNG